MSLDGAIDATARDATATDITPDVTTPDVIPPDVTTPDAIPPDVKTQVDAPKVLFGDDFQDGKLDPGAWQYWRVSFAEKSGRLSVLPQARPGFNYGHSGNGRGAEVVTHVGDKTWTDYRLEVDLSATGIDSGFNLYGLPLCYTTAQVLFRITEAKESWNAAATSRYRLSLQLATCEKATLGTYSVSRVNGYWIPGTGWQPNHNGTGTTLMTGGPSPFINSGVNKFVIEVKGSRIQVWVVTANGVSHELADVQDTANGPLSYGGVGVTWGYEGQGWVDNVKVTQL
ncbi:MAG: hypothetical protein KAI47_18630 [Deltaproteobacteria bacterium]|nr:hypothetical protein [Deltaproteobacteria bacterium]